MTSEEIRQEDYLLTNPDGKQEKPEVALCFWVRELALQSAIRNEHNARMDEEDAEERRKKPEMLGEFLARANGTLDRIGAPPTPFYAVPLPGQGKPE